jgi:hypothetical protein
VLVSLQVTSTRSADLTRVKSLALHCAKSGLVTGHSQVAANFAGWNAALAAGTEPDWLSSLDHDLDDDGNNDFVITLKDNNDETGTDDPDTDNDLTVWLISTCTKYSDAPTQVSEMVRYNGANNCYDAQLGGCGGNANANSP